MKRFACFLLSTVFFANSALAQNANYKTGKYNKNVEFTDSKSPFSFKVGYNLSNVIVSPEPLNIINSKNGFHFGIVANSIQLGSHVGIQPELLYSMQGFKIGGLGNVGLHYLSLPILLKMDLGGNASILVGPQVSYLINAKIGIGNDLFSVSYAGIFQKWDACLVAGLEYRVNDKISLGGRYLLGLNNINKDFNLGQNNTFNDYFSLKNSTAQFYMTVNL